MGGSGSGRPRSYDRKTTVEDSLVLTAEAFKPFMDMARWSVGTMNWNRGEEKVASISFRPVEDMAGRAFRFTYTAGIGENAREGDYTVRMVKAAPHFGGVRWYFLCPLKVNGRPCLRRVSKLYLPPGVIYFGCRVCYRLTYTSSQESHKFDGLFAHLAASMGRGITLKEVKGLLNPRKGAP
jgi:hypothetical protein